MALQRPTPLSHPASSLPDSAVLAAWLGACRSGLVGPDDLAEQVRRDAPRHLVVGLAEEPFDLDGLPGRVTGPATLALPVPGDLVGLGGPAELNRAALEAGEAVLVPTVLGAVGLVPEEDARTIAWRAHPAQPAPSVDERETAIGLRTALAQVTARLVDLDVASWAPEVPDLLMNLRHRRPLPLPPGLDARRVETVERAVLCREIVALAGEDDGGSVTAHDVQQRRTALVDLDRAARHALVGALSAHA